MIPSVPKVPATRISALKSSTRNRRQHSAEVNQLATGFPPVNWPKTTTTTTTNNQQPTTNNQQLPTTTNNYQPTTNQPNKQTKGDLECGVGVANAPEPIVRAGCRDLLVNSGTTRGDCQRGGIGTHEVDLQPSLQLRVMIVKEKQQW